MQEPTSAVILVLLFSMCWDTGYALSHVLLHLFLLYFTPGNYAWSVLFWLFLQDTFSSQTTLYVSRTQRRCCNIHSFFSYCLWVLFTPIGIISPSRWKGNFYLISFCFWRSIRFLWFTLNKIWGLTFNW